MKGHAPAPIDLAEIEHAEHELEIARGRLRLLRMRALLAAGWKIKPSATWPERWPECYWPPQPIRSRRGKQTRYLHTMSEAWIYFRTQARRACGATSCERRPRLNQPRGHALQEGTRKGDQPRARRR